jgi:integrase
LVLSDTLMDEIATAKLEMVGLLPEDGERILAPVQVAAGVVNAKGGAKYGGTHAFRHFYASWCINRRQDGGLELPIKTVQQRLGHSSIVMTSDVYGHLFPRGDDGSEMAAAEKLLLT